MSKQRQHPSHHDSVTEPDRDPYSNSLPPPYEPNDSQYYSSGRDWLIYLGFLGAVGIYYFSKGTVAAVHAVPGAVESAGRLAPQIEGIVKSGARTAAEIAPFLL